MLCKVAAGFSDVRCPVCGQGFLVYWTRQRELSREEQRVHVQRALREQHAGTENSDIHAPAFQIADNPAVMPQILPAPVPATAIPVYN